MAEAIWKFTLTAYRESNSFFADMPTDPKPLSAGWQDGNFVVWAIVDPRPGTVLKRRFFHISGTGHDLPEALRHGGKLLNRVEVNAPSGLLIFHVFDTQHWDTRNG